MGTHDRETLGGAYVAMLVKELLSREFYAPYLRSEQHPKPYHVALTG